MTPFEHAVCYSSANPFKGATRAALAAHGIPWPPPRGWRKAMKARILARKEGETSRSTIVLDALIIGAMGLGV